MKSYRMLPFVIFIVSSLSFGGEPTDTFPTNPNYPYNEPPSRPTPNLHQHNKDIAYASAILVTQNYSTPSEWKSIYRKSLELSPGMPEGPSQRPQKPTSTDVAAVDVKYGEVYFVTQYNVRECEDGTTMVERSGVIVSLTSATQGRIGGFAEIIACAELVGSPGPLVPSPAFDKADPDRPLDWSNITKSN